MLQPLTDKLVFSYLLIDVNDWFHNLLSDFPGVLRIVGRF
jgi:hypothetical protein